MGRHSATRRGRPQFERTAFNAIIVLMVTLAAALIVFVGITTLAIAKANEIPPPTLTSVGPAGAPQGHEAPANSGRPPAAGGNRTCPATGCTASTCHAETGEPPPHR